MINYRTKLILNPKTISIPPGIYLKTIDVLLHDYDMYKKIDDI